MLRDLELHQPYIEQVIHADGPSGPYVPDDWWCEQGRDGARAVLLYRRTTPMTVTDGQGVRTVEPVVDADTWPTGVGVLWDQFAGWRYVALEEDGQPGAHPEPLPVPVYAHPDAVLALLVLLLDGDPEMPACEQKWQHAEALADQLADPDPGGPPIEKNTRIQATVADPDRGVHVGDRGTVIRHDPETGTTVVDWDSGERQRMQMGHRLYQALPAGLADPAQMVRVRLAIKHMAGPHADAEHLVDVRHLAYGIRVLTNRVAERVRRQLQRQGGPGWLSVTRGDARVAVTGATRTSAHGPIDLAADTLAEEITTMVRVCASAWATVA
jgi:hypothetical protein